ncbi:MAG: septal ring lytic transglycosylase RlpA family protein [Patescibacteria group bacterium]|mgnify:CR=1 FL=1
MFFIKKQFENIISWGIVSFCFFIGFGLLVYSFYIIYPLDEVFETENENINFTANPDVKVITQSLNNVKINIFTESELREIEQKNNEIKKQEQEKAKTMEIKKKEEEKKAMEIKQKAEEEIIDKRVKPEIGVASWYCPKWCAKLAAAHAKYPKGTKLKVTNLENKKSVIVIVNDFGPNKSIHPDRIIDLTKTAFQKIANIQDGTIKVKVEKMIN